MSTRYSQIAIYWCLLCGILDGQAQSTYRVGLLPSLNIHRSLSPTTGINLKAEGRHIFQEGSWGQEPVLEQEFTQADFSILGVQKIGIYQKVAVGYLLRSKDNALFHRSLQQFTWVRTFSQLVLAHRFASDQTFAVQDAPTFRLRYRLSTELPLAGLKADVQEFYVKIHNEYLSSWHKKEQEWELRGVPVLGFKFSDKNKVEVGLDYRLSRIFQADRRSSFWLKVNGFLRI